MGFGRKDRLKIKAERPIADNETLAPTVKKPIHFNTLKKLRNQKAFIEAYCETSMLGISCERAGVSRTSVYSWLETDPEFAMSYMWAAGVVGDNLEDAARARAVYGEEKPVYQGGVLVGAVVEKSDGLLQFLLKGYKPEKYKDRIKQEISTPPGESINLRTIDTAALIKLVEDERAKNK